MSLLFPNGEVVDGTIQFDVVLWGSSDSDVKQFGIEVHGNLDLIRDLVDAVNEQASEFNDTLVSEVRSAVERRAEEITMHDRVFDALNIPEESETPLTPVRSKVGPIRKLSNHRVCVHVENQYVESLHQTNNNIGDVNNAIQSNE